MKKCLFLSVFALIFALSSCSDKYITEVTEVYVDVITINYKVKATDWLVGSDDSGDYLYYTFTEPKITRDVFERGLVVPYMVSFDGNLSPLPFDDSWSDGHGYRWTEQVTCEFKTGEITFIFKANDHSLEPYYDYDFVVKIMVP
jgi:hypothetical protein